jgi:hypothetical protein
MRHGGGFPAVQVALDSSPRRQWRGFRTSPRYCHTWCGWSVPKWFMVYNHLHTVHAIAAGNAAEVAMGMLMEATVPGTHRWIPKEMTVHYLEKATTSLRARAQLEPPDFTPITDGPDGFELVVPVTVTTAAAPKWCTQTSPPGSRRSAMRELSTSRARDTRARRRTPAPRSRGRHSDCGS